MFKVAKIIYHPIFFGVLNFLLLKSTNFLCIVKVDRHCLPPTVFVGHLTIGAIPVFFNSVFLFFGFFCLFLSQNREEPFIYSYHVQSWNIHARLQDLPLLKRCYRIAWAIPVEQRIGSCRRGYFFLTAHFQSCGQRFIH